MKKTIYILTLSGVMRAAVTENPAEIYWNRGSQQMDDMINVVSVFCLFENAEKYEPDELERLIQATGGYPIYLTEFDEMTHNDFRQEAFAEVEAELTAFDVYAEHHKLPETSYEYFLEQRGKLIYLLDRLA
jgi:hypothetical protein